MFNTFRFCSSYSLIVLLACFTLFTAGCPTGSRSKEEKDWIATFKTQLKGAEEQLFSSNFLQNEVDPFFLDEIFVRLPSENPLSTWLNYRIGRFPKDQSLPVWFTNRVEKLNTLNTLNKLPRDKAVPDWFKEQIESKKEDYELSWTTFRYQLENIEDRYALVGVLPALELAELVAKLSGSFDDEILKLAGMFQEKIKKGTVFVQKTGRSIPNQFTAPSTVAMGVRRDVLELANKIAARALVISTSAANSAFSNWPMLNEVPERAKELRIVVRVLNPTVAEQAGEPLKADVTPNIRDPRVNFAELGKIYDTIFAALVKIEIPNSSQQLEEWRVAEDLMLAALKTSLTKQSDLAKFILNSK